MHRREIEEDPAEARARFMAHATKHLQAIGLLLIEDVNLTLVAQFPDRPDATVVVTNDVDLDSAIKALSDARLRPQGSS